MPQRLRSPSARWRRHRQSCRRASARVDSVACAPSGLCVAAQGSVIRASLDWGATWKDSDTLIASEEVADTACSANACFAVSNSSEGAYLGRTLDGTAWKWRGLGESVTAVGVACGPSSCTASIADPSEVGPVSIRFSSSLVTQAGFVLLGDVPDMTVSDIACSDNVNCVAVGDGQPPILRLRYNSSGETWSGRCETTASRCRDSYRHVACSAKTCVAIAGSGRIYSSTDFGVTWLRRASLSAVTLNSISCVSSKICVAVGSGGKIYRSTDSGRTWRSVASPTRRTLRTVSCTSTGRCIAAGDAGTLIRTTSSGGSWTLRPALP